jgi:hypothetical protein
VGIAAPSPATETTCACIPASMASTNNSRDRRWLSPDLIAEHISTRRSPIQ